jgi:hypothetical protein
MEDTLRENKGKQLSFFVYPAIASLFLLAHGFLLGGNRPFWLDEVFTAYFVKDPSVSHMIEANRDAINAFPPMYFLVLRLWAGLFGATEWTLRLFTTVCFCAGVWVLWTVLQKRFGSLPAAFALTASVVCHWIILEQNVQARQYGLMFLLGAIVLSHFAYLTERPRRGWEYFLHTLLHLAMILTHSLTLIYSGCFLLAGVLPDVLGKRIDRHTIGRAVAIIASWVLFAVLWGKEVLAQRQAFQPYSWIPTPNRRTLIEYLLWFPTPLTLILGGITLLFLLILWIRFRPQIFDTVRQECLSNRVHLLLAGILIALLPGLLLFILSQKGTSLFLTRYFLLTSMGWAVSIAFLTSVFVNGLPVVLEHHALYQKTVRVFLLGVPTVLLIAHSFGSLSYRGKSPTPQPPQIFATLAEWGKLRPVPLFPVFDVETLLDGKYPDLPIGWTDAFAFAPAHYYKGNRNRYYLLQDYPYVEQSGHRIGFLHSLFINFSALQRHYPQANVISWEEFGKKYHKFLIYDARSHTQGVTWVAYRLLQNPQYRLTVLHTVENRVLYLVEFIGKRSP